MYPSPFALRTHLRTSCSLFSMCVFVLKTMIEDSMCSMADYLHLQIFQGGDTLPEVSQFCSYILVTQKKVRREEGTGYYQMTFFHELSSLPFVLFLRQFLTES